MECSHEAIRQHLQQIGKVLKEGVWVPHQLSTQNRIQRVTIASSLLARNSREPFLDRIVTGDEKWVLYVNVKKRKQWLSSGQRPVPMPKPGLHPQKIMLCIWWDMRGVVHWELLDPNLTITADVYCQQLVRLSQALVRNRPSLVNRKGVILQHDNARPHIARVTQQKIRELGWEVLPHSPYSPDMAPSDYHLFRSLQHHLSGQEFEDEEDVKQAITSFIASKTTDFFKRGIENLVIRWEAVVDNEGDYILDLT
jgi:[histone H3]-lysine36 N-dimethyltransferase SETMAR